jgi:hypothetical protein
MNGIQPLVGRVLAFPNWNESHLLAFLHCFAVLPAGRFNR